MNYIITIFSKNKKSIINFFNFFNKKLLPTTQCSIVTLQKQKKKTFKTIAILKSPHVNKKAQVHFGSKRLSKQIFVFSPKPLKFFICLKKVQNCLFPDIRIKVTVLVKPNKTDKLAKKLLNPKKFLIDFTKIYSKEFSKVLVQKPNVKISPLKTKISKTKKIKKMLAYNTIKYLKIWDCYGETQFLNY